MLYYKVLYNNNILYYTILCCECCQCIWCSFRLKWYCNCLHSFWSCRILFTLISSFLLPLYNCFIYSTECWIVCRLTCLLFYVSICLWVCMFICLSNCMQIRVYQPRLHFFSLPLPFPFPSHSLIFLSLLFLLTGTGGIEAQLKEKLDSNGIKKGDDLIVMVVNEGEIDLFLNFACSCRAVNLSMKKVFVFAASR